MKKEHMDRIDAAVKAVVAKKHINHFYFVACGGSQAFMMPARYIMDMETAIPSSIYTSNEFIHTAPKALGPDSVVITCSHSGNTPETVKAAEFARGKGALTIAVSNLVDSPLWSAAEYQLHYDWDKQSDFSDLNKGILFTFIFKLLNALEPCRKYEKAIEAVDHVGECIRKARDLYAPEMAGWAKKYKREPLIYTMGSGTTYGEAYSFAICLLMEMQWINSSCIHSGEYFHGPFEVTDFDVPFIIIKSNGPTRPLDERAYNFCSKYSEKIMLIDENRFDMSGIDEEVRPYFGSVVSGSVLRSLADYLAYERGHELSVRRYMWKMEY